MQTNTHGHICTLACITCKKVRVFYLDANTCTSSAALRLQWVALLLGGCEAAECF